MTEAVPQARPEPLEIAAGVALESFDTPRCPPPQPHGPSARHVLEDLLLGHLASARTTAVSFSGGRDSSLVLALACHVARREGLSSPVAVTIRHPSPDSREDEWQELVIRHLGVQDWLTVDVGDTLDVLGSRSTGLLDAVGVQLPPNAYLHLAVAERVGRATVVTGIGGDEVLSGNGERAAAVLSRRVGPRPRDVLTMGLAAAPSAARRRWRARKGFPMAPWLKPAAEREVASRWAADEVRYALRWDRAAATWVRGRTVALGRQALRSMGDPWGVEFLSPLAEASFVDTFAHEVGWAGPQDRTWSMGMIGADLLPPALLSRRSKASFGGQIWGPQFRSFAESWSPSELPAELADLVDGEILRRNWLREDPFYCSMALVQRAWLERRARSAT